MGARSSQSRGPGLNETDGHLLEYFRNTFSGGGGASTQGPPGFGTPQGLTATGGVINDYTTTPGDVYRAHIFTSSGTFDVTASGAFGDTLEYLVVAGGGSGGGFSGANGGGGGGAGGLRTNLTDHPLAGVAYPVPAFPTSYTVTIGAGAQINTSPSSGNRGSNSEFYPTPVSYPSTAFIRSVGGGAGGYTPEPATTGGSGGGGAAPTNSVVAGNTPTDPNNPQPQGNPGGSGNSNGSRGGGGGGGGGGAGENASGSWPGGIAGNGGLALQVLIAGPSTTNPTVGTPGPSGTGWFAGGGGGSGTDETFGDTKRGVGGRGPDHSATTPYGGGGNGQPGGSPVAPQPNGLSSTGGGGGGGRTPNNAGSGGSGIVVVRYQIGRVTAAAKATGGAISYYNNKTIHAFTGSGTFVTNSGFSETVEYFMVAGGGGGGGSSGGGGGAGGYLTGTSSVAHPAPLTVTVGSGGSREIGNGGDTSINFPAGTLTAAGGGHGGSNFTGTPGTPGTPGGSGGGSLNQGTSQGNGNQYGPTSPLNPAPAPGQGNNGAAGGSNPTIRGGGGGGAGGAGSSAAGGVGIQMPATFRDPRSAPGPGSNPISGGGLGTPGPSGQYWFAGGGGGGKSYPATGGSGGAGGGGTGGAQAVGTVAVQNTGGGGGGGGFTPGEHAGANGGSGIVLIAYPS